MKITLGKKFVTLSPKPTTFKVGGIKATFNRDGKYVEATATCDIVAGKSRYMLPRDTENRFVVKVELT